MKTELPKHGAGVFSFMFLTGFLFFLPSAALAQAQCFCMPRDGGNAIYYSCNSPPPTRCTGGSTGGSSSSRSSSAGNSAAVIGNAIGQAIIQGLLSSPQQDASQRAAEEERRRQLLLQQQRRHRELEEQRREKLEQDRRELLGQMLGGSDGGLHLTGEDTVGELSFKEYHERETERREVLERLSKRALSDSEAKATLDWCKLHPPLYPTRSDEQYQEKLASYGARMAEWRQKCASSDEFAGSSVTTLPAASGPGSQRQAATQESPQVLPQSCTDCLAQQQQKVRDCRQPTLMDQLDCVNTANKEWDRCQETCRP